MVRPRGAGGSKSWVLSWASGPWGGISWLVRQNHALGAVERIGSRDDDLSTGCQSVHEVDLGDAGGGEPPGMAFGHVAVHEIGKAAAFLIPESAAIDHQYIVALVDQNP